MKRAETEFTPPIEISNTLTQEMQVEEGDHSNQCQFELELEPKSDQEVQNVESIQKADDVTQDLGYEAVDTTKEKLDTTTGNWN